MNVSCVSAASAEDQEETHETHETGPIRDQIRVRVTWARRIWASELRAQFLIVGQVAMALRHRLARPWHESAMGWPTAHW